jgi:uncharacterized protein YcnI
MGVPNISNTLIDLRRVLKSAMVRAREISMKAFRQTTRQTPQIFAALILTSILSLGAGMTLLDAATANSVESPQGVASPKQSRNSQVPRSVVNAVRRDLSRTNRILPSKLSVVTSSPQTWPDTCLGLSKPGEVCGQMLVDGWRVVMSDGRKNWSYRTDSTGSTVRLESQETPSKDQETPSSSNLPNSVSKAVLQAAAGQLGVPSSQLQIKQAQQQTWSDGCLNLPSPVELCASALTPGWRVIVEGKQQRLVYHSNATGSQVRLNKNASGITDAKLPKSIADAVLQVASGQLKLPSSQLRITRAEQQTWTDGCLGLPSPVERCMGVLTPGWRVIVEGKQQVQSYRTDDTGARVRAEEVAAQPPSVRNLPDSVAKVVLQDASRQSNLPSQALRIVQAEEREWPNGCLGLDEPGRLCTRQVVPGWQVTVKGGKQSFVYRTDESGSLIKLEGGAAQGSGAAQGNSSAVKIPQSELPPPLSEDVVFRVITSGGITGRTFETRLLKDGTVIRDVAQPDNLAMPAKTHKISREQLQQFQQLLEQQRFSQFNQLSYQAPNGAADYLTITLTSKAGTTRYADMGQNRLPEPLQAVIQAWKQIVINR